MEAKKFIHKFYRKFQRK